MKKLAPQSKAVLLALLSVLFWSFAATSFKKALEFNEPWTLVFLSSAVSTVVLFVTLVAGGRKVYRKDAVSGALLGLLNPFLYYMVLLRAYHGLPAQIAMVVNYLWPVVLVLLSVPLLGQKLTAGSVAGTFVSFAGVALLALMGRKTMSIPPVPLVLALLSTLIWAVYWLMNTRNRGGVNAVLLMSFCFGTAYLALYGALRGHSFAPAGGAVPWIAYIGVFEMGLTYIIWNTALRTASSTASVGNMVFLAPFVSLIPITLVVGETIAPSTVLGLVLVITGIFLEKRFRRRKALVSP